MGKTTQHYCSEKDRSVIKPVADILITNGLLVDPVLGAVEKADLSIKDGRIFSYSPVNAHEKVDAAGSFISCGFIDSHLHVEGLHLLPEHYGNILISHGTTAVVTDLHEIANAGGLDGLKWYLSRAATSPIDLFIMAPSCVPSSRFEMGGARIGVGQLTKLASWPQVIGLGEVMNIEGITKRNKEVMGKINLFSGKPIDGHAPGLTGPILDEYLSAGIHSDHETDNLDEAIEKLSKGMHLFIREGSVAKDLQRLISVVTPPYLDRLSLCTDDLSAHDLLQNGHLDNLLGILVRSGIPLIKAIKLITTNPVQYFNLSDRKGLGIGKKADIVVFTNPEHPEVTTVIKNGRIAYRQGEAIRDYRTEYDFTPLPLKVRIPSIEELIIPAAGNSIRVIGVTEGSIVTDDLEHEATIIDGSLAASPDNDIILAYVFDRYRATKRFGFAFAKGFNLKNGAIGSTYAHDSHNLIVIGDNIEDIHHVAHTLKDGGGGIAARHNGETRYISMPYFGMLSDVDCPTFLKAEKDLMLLVRKMEVHLKDPFFQMSFLSLPVIPRLRITAKGLFCVTTLKYVKVNQ